MISEDILIVVFITMRFPLLVGTKKEIIVVRLYSRFILSPSALFVSYSAWYMLFLTCSSDDVTMISLLKKLYSDLLRENRTDPFLEAGIGLSFCSDPRVDKYIQDHGLTKAPRSPSLIPDYEPPAA